MDYLDTLDKALSHLRQLELDKAIKLLFELLESHPKDLELINRIYVLEVKRPLSKGFKKICLHIFSLNSNQDKIHQLILTTYGEYSLLNSHNFEFNQLILFNLFLHLGRSHLTQDTDKLRQKLKQDFAEHPDIAEHLKINCEQLIEQKKIIQARQEIKYLISYYAETDAGRWAIKIKLAIENNIIH